MSATLREIEERLPDLSYQERITLIERLAQTLRGESKESWEAWDAELEEMAADPEIQREIKEIDDEFAVALQDGLHHR